ncbi:MAG: FMN-binding protein [Lentisphaerae bacterium]|jgi:RnfABCDGE-type electron transport complex G subunit|nr:FMN-binding protein [Lentisphaerota bacterium]
MKEILRLTLSIGLVCLIGGAALAYVNVKTDGPRQEAAAKTLVDSLKLVLPPETASTTKAASVDGVDFYDAQDSAGRTIARAAVGSSSLGFGGEMKVLVGLSPDNRILGVMVTEHNETPGLGTKATNRKAQKSLWDVLAGKATEDAFPPNAYLDSFTDRPATGFSLGSDSQGQTVQAISGATTSCKAVLDAVNAVCRAVHTTEGR